MDTAEAKIECLEGSVSAQIISATWSDYNRKGPMKDVAKGQSIKLDYDADPNAFVRYDATIELRLTAKSPIAKVKVRFTADD